MAATLDLHTTVNEQLPELPQGYTTRAGSVDDYLLYFDLINAHALYQTGDVDVTDPELVRQDWSDPKFHPAESTHWVFAPDGALVGAVEVWDTGNPPVHPWIWGCVRPGYFGQGIGEYLLAWGEARAQRALQRVPAGLRFAPRTGTTSTNKDARTLFESRGWIHTRSYYRMVTVFETDPMPATVPSGITIRPFDPATELEEVTRTVIDAFRDHYGFVERPFEEHLHEMKHHFMGDPLYDPSLWFVAMDGDKMTGICICRAEDYEHPEWGFVNELGMRREWRKRGIATALLRHAFHVFHQRGKKGAALGVDATNLTGALRIYESVGMHPARQYDNFEKEFRPGREISTQAVQE